MVERINEVEQMMNSMEKWINEKFMEMNSAISLICEKVGILNLSIPENSELQLKALSQQTQLDKTEVNAVTPLNEGV